ncbi:MAG: hypothetical protein QM820_17620 [Minicystis sp.]
MAVEREERRLDLLDGVERRVVGRVHHLAHDARGHVLGDDGAPRLEHGFLRREPAQRAQAVAAGRERRHLRAVVVELGEELLAQGDQHLGARRVVRRRQPGAARLGGVAERGRDAVLHEVGQLAHQRAQLVGAIAAEGEDLLELIEDQHRHHGPPARVPEAGPVKVLPERLALARRRAVQLPALRGLAQAPPYLLGQRRLALSLLVHAEPQPETQRDEPRLAHAREEPGLQERRLPEPRFAVEHRERPQLDEREQLLRLAPAPVEEGRVLLVERAGARVRVLGIEEDLLGLGAHGGGAPSMKSNVASRSACTTSRQAPSGSRCAAMYV